MDILVLKMLIKDQRSPKSWEKLARVLLLKFASELRDAKKDCRRVVRAMKAQSLATRRPEHEALLAEYRAIEREANNAFQGAKEWWREYAPTQEKE